MNEPRSISKRISQFISRKPVLCLISSLFICIVITIICFVDVKYGRQRLNFVVGSKGWRSRGTVISKRGIQYALLSNHFNSLYNDEFLSDITPSSTTMKYDSPWDYLQEEVVPNFTSGVGRRLSQSKITDSCNIEWYNYIKDANAFNAIFSSDSSLLEPESLLKMCEAERITIDALRDNNFCSYCLENEPRMCPLPISLSTTIRSALGLGGNESCNGLIDAYIPKRYDITKQLIDCANALRYQNYTQSCSLPLFSSLFVDADFGKEHNSDLKLSASYFYISSWITDSVARDLYTMIKSFPTSSNNVNVLYETSGQNFKDIATNEYMLADLKLAMIAVVVTTITIFIHTKSLWLTLIGCLQILFAAPLAFFCYYFIGNISFFPILNLIGLFVSAALGADDLFVATDKWKNARLQNKSKSTEEIAKIALPDAAGAMALTTSTTCVAFFATCVSNVAPILTFALFCGLLVAWNYILNVALVFPALVIYDRWLLNGRKNFFIICCMSKTNPYQQNCDTIDEDEEEHNTTPFIHGILSYLYQFLHQFRLAIIAITIVSIAVSAYFASQIRLPQNSEVRMLPRSNSFELHNTWFRKLLSYDLRDSTSDGFVIFGVKPADNGNHLDPDSLSNLVLDDTFDPSTTDAQIFLTTFCTEFNEKFPNKSVCSIASFDEWLATEAQIDNQLNGYSLACGENNSLPMEESYFHSCFIFWFRNVGYELYGFDRPVLDRDGKVRIMWLKFKTSVRYDDNASIIIEEWKLLDDWLKESLGRAPKELHGGFIHGGVFWWGDTSTQVLQTAFSAAGIALVFSVILVFLSSVSIRLTIISGLCIVYILVASTASLVSLGWELGFLESVCFAILIGISCDFVIHLNHAYNTSYANNTSRELRTMSALKHIGPSILAGAFTTFSAGLVMVFCKLSFFSKFAEMLMVTICHALIASFLIYIVFVDKFGPEKKIELIDFIYTRCKKNVNRNNNMKTETDEERLEDNAETVQTQ